MRFTCLCYAIPKKLVQHLADQSEGEHRQALLDQVSHTETVRSTRAQHTKEPPATAKGASKLHRRIFTAQGQTMLPGQQLRDEGQADSHDPQANQLYDNLGIVLKFFKDVLNRDSADGQGMRIDASVHYGYRFANAMWTGQQMIVGDGDGKHIAGLPASLGLIAHEFCHGVSQHLIAGGLGVVLRPGQPPSVEGEAGALNESFSDVFASMVKQWHRNQDADDPHTDWLLGEDVITAGSGHAVRSLADPGNRELTWPEDDQIRQWSQYTPGIDAHTASGIANHAFYVAATQVGGKSWENFAAVWLDAYGRLHSKSTFREAADATVDVAAARHGAGSKVHEAVKAGWKKVGVLA
jgi:Zn-dependent metalloprotease